MLRPPDVVMASGCVATTAPNAINPPAIAARPTVIPTRYPARTLTPRIHAAAAVREPIVLPRHAARGLLPAARNEASLLEPPQRRGQRPLLEIEEAVRSVLQLVQDLEPVLLLPREEREQAELDRSLLQLRRP